mmetsp:Transcript_14971/g.32273  ORF Transcript_14971/g.32273 Transcript_14971/m.32273 type:complete len:227 (+) Transcript_14971:111-791(+)
MDLYGIHHVDTLFTMLEGELRKDVRNIAQSIVEHKSKDSHLRGTSIVQLNTTLLQLPRIALLIPSKIKESITEITLELGLASRLISVGNFHKDEGGNELSGDFLRQGAPRGPTGGNILESGETNSGVRGEVSHDSEHGDTAVLQFESAETVELGSVYEVEFAAGVPDSEGGLGSDVVTVVCLGREGGGHGALGGGGEGRGAGDGGEEESKLHHCCYYCFLKYLVAN